MRKYKILLTLGRHEVGPQKEYDVEELDTQEIHGVVCQFLEQDEVKHSIHRSTQVLVWDSPSESRVDNLIAVFDRSNGKIIFP